jgi:hypothetical protein
MTEKKKTIQELKDSEFLIEGEDYGKIPGVKKPCLLQPGAQKIAKYYGYTYAFEIQEAVEQHQERFYFYRVRGIIILDGVIVGDMIGSCSTYDSGKQNAPPNSIVKIAEKRAFVSAVLYVVAGSGVFSADVEDMTPDELGDSGDGIKWFPCKWSNGFCAACGNKHTQQGDLVGKVDGKWMAKACYEHLKSVEGASTPEDEDAEANFRKTLEQMDIEQLREFGYDLADEKHIRVDLFGDQKDEIIAFIMKERKSVS